ncbi:unnamed protein product, partial [Prorocentrum cordatum]
VPIVMMLLEPLIMKVLAMLSGRSVLSHILVVNRRALNAFMKMPFIIEVDERTILLLQMLVGFLKISIVGLLMAGLAALVEFLVVWSLMVVLALPIVGLPMGLKIAPPLGLLAALGGPGDGDAQESLLVFLIVDLLMTFLDNLVVVMVVRALTESLMFLIVDLLTAFVAALGGPCDGDAQESLLVFLIVGLLMTSMDNLVVVMVVRALTESLMFLIVDLLMAFVAVLVLMMFPALSTVSLPWL